MTFFTDPKEPSPIPLMVIEVDNDQNDSNQERDGAAEQADNGAAEEAENIAAEQVENGDGMANVEVEPTTNEWR